MKRRRLLTAVPAAALALPGCARPGATPVGPVTISFGSYDNLAQQYEDYAEAFTAAYPNISVEVVPVTPPRGATSTDYRQRLANEAEFIRAFATDG